jgi:predicted RecA/RadA family phage recombinase
MAYTGQPVPSTQLAVIRAKISDGKSILVKVPSGKTADPQKFYLFDGFFGVAMESGVEGQEINLQIELAEYETDNIVTAEAFNKGDKIYWDNTAGKFTITSTSNRLVGKVTAPKDSNNVIWFLLLPQQ